ncbi:hypothetical protein [Tropicibacter sp. S64]|uniref:hypothetical protein n=1 Tax=Tropicibacter sp. S64 TaxID=3415122 RepID=UPI003C7B4725
MTHGSADRRDGQDHMAMQGALPGAGAVIDWFGLGRMPRFHDAEVCEHDLETGRHGHLKLRTWRMTGRVDPKGFYITDRHAVVTLTFAQVTRLELEDAETPGIVGSLTLSRLEDGSGHRVVWDSSWGIWGSVEGQGLSLTLEPMDASPL